MTEAIQGLAECLAETKSPEEALKFVKSSIKKTVDQQKINEITKYVKMLQSGSLEEGLKFLEHTIKETNRTRAT